MIGTIFHLNLTNQAIFGVSFWDLPASEIALTCLEQMIFNSKLTGSKGNNVLEKDFWQAMMIVERNMHYHTSSTRLSATNMFVFVKNPQKKNSALEGSDLYGFCFPENEYI